MLRHALRLATIVFALGSTGCGGLDTIVLSEERTISLPTPTRLSTLRSFPLFFEHASDLPDTGVNPKHIESVKLKRLELVLHDPSPVRDLNFIDELQVYVQTPTTPSRLIASSGPLERGANVATLTIQDAELRDYLAAKNAQIRVLFVGTQPLAQIDVSIEADFLIDVHVKNVIF